MSGRRGLGAAGSWDPQGDPWSERPRGAGCGVKRWSLWVWARGRRGAVALKMGNTEKHPGEESASSGREIPREGINPCSQNPPQNPPLRFCVRRAEPSSGYFSWIVVGNDARGRTRQGKNVRVLARGRVGAAGCGSAEGESTSGSAGAGTPRDTGFSLENPKGEANRRRLRVCLDTFGSPANC